MRKESCRKCGNELKIKQSCSICKFPNKFTCKNCRFETDEQIHSICKILDTSNRFIDSKAV